MTTKTKKAAAAMKRGAMLGGMSKSEAKKKAVRINGKGGGRPGYRCIVEWRPWIVSAWLQHVDHIGNPVVYPSRRAALADIERFKLIGAGDNPEREFRVTRI